MRGLADDPEPVFTLRAQDRLALNTLAYYTKLCRMNLLGDQADEVVAAIEEMKGWQERNPERMKMPDHKHINANATGGVP